MPFQAASIIMKRERLCQRKRRQLDVEAAASGQQGGPAVDSHSWLRQRLLQIRTPPYQGGQFHLGHLS